MYTIIITSKKKKKIIIHDHNNSNKNYYVATMFHTFVHVVFSSAQREREWCSADIKLRD